MTREHYGKTFESGRRLHPRIWDSDYLILKGLKDEVRRFRATLPNVSGTIIDYGCGAKPYRTLFDPSARYIGVDVCQNPAADVTIAEGETVPFPDGTADALLSIQVVYLIKDYDFYLRECSRLVKNGGLLLICSHGTWTFHPASGGDYYRFTQDGMRYILESAGFELMAINPIIGTLAAGLHLRQLIFNSWLRRAHLGLVASAFNVITNLRMMFEDSLSPRGTRLSSPAILSCLARKL